MAWDLETWEDEWEEVCKIFVSAPSYSFFVYVFFNLSYSIQASDMLFEDAAE